MKDPVASAAKECSCWQKSNCPLAEKCLSEYLVYHAQVDRSDINETKNYYGACKKYLCFPMRQVPLQQVPLISFSNFLSINLFSWNLLFYFCSGFSYLSTQFLCLLKRLNLVQSWTLWLTVHHVFEFLFLYFFRCCESWWIGIS